MVALKAYYMEERCFALARITRNESRGHQYSHKMKFQPNTEGFLNNIENSGNSTSHNLFPPCAADLAHPNLVHTNLVRAAGARTRWHKVRANWRTAIKVKYITNPEHPDIEIISVFRRKTFQSTTEF